MSRERVRNYSDVSLLVNCHGIPRLPHDQMMAQSLAICAEVDARRGGQTEPLRKICVWMTEAEREELYQMHLAGMTNYEIAMATGRKHSTVIHSIRRSKRQEENSKCRA